MNQPGYFIQKAIARAKYNVGRVQKEAGLALDRQGSMLVNDVAYLNEGSRHRQQLPLYDCIPQAHGAWIAPNASLIGNVNVSKWATVWYNVIIRAELNAVRIGHFSSIGDGTSIYTAHSLPHGLSASVNIGKNVVVESGCSIHSCIIDDDCVIGANSVIGEGARLERGCHILPNSVVPPGRLIPAGQVWGGNTVKFVRNLTEEEQLQNYTASYNKGAPSEGASDFSLWPHEVKKDIAQGQETMDEYVQKHYFNNL